ncbi:sensor histidine kinase [Ancylomarina euxinus]|uniref:sensor histidine kinase n=1 Tax=Ancylomarina euxinus TaxID=2283627 RepID=UPI0013154A5C|nr:HAMP domain-containing sensor histidine kinase [Ancylomarina euxinus]MCZ4695337.1 HAMP domain-containing sensor histidine kinase [Ancylomarina euxinus]
MFPFQANSQKLKEINRKRICLIHSYNCNFPTYTHVSKAINEFIDSTDYQIDVEFMNSKEFVDDVYIERFHDFLSYKLSKRKAYDLFLVADDYALEYVLKYEESLFKNKPIVFWGVNNIDLAIEQNSNPYCTGVVEDVSVKETLNLAKTLNPKLEEIFVISDNTITGKNDLKRMLKLKDLTTLVNIHTLNLSELSFSEFENNLQQLKGEKALLLLSLYRDKDFKYKPFYDGLNLIKKNSDLAIYHLWKHGVGEGIVGGNLIHHYRQTQEALKMADQILKGADIKDMPVLEESPNQCYLDYNELKRLNLMPAIFPNDWTIINRPSSSIHLSKRSLYLFLSISMCVCGLLFFFIYYAKKQNCLKKELIKAQRNANRVDELKNAFLSNISHEIRTPLNGILGFSEFLSLPDVNDDDRIKYFEIITENSHQLLNVVNEIVEIAKVQSGHSEIKMEMVDIYSLLSEIVPEYRLKSEQKNLKLMLMNSKVVKSVYADRQYLSKIIRKLLDNAIKFTHDGCIEIGYYKRMDFIEFYVKDTGIGISNDLVHIIFENFRQVQESDIRQYGGLGLGLSITKAFVKSMGGKIWVESKENKGSCFYFTLPYKEQDLASLISAEVYFSGN